MPTLSLPVIDSVVSEGRKPAWLKVRAPGGPNYIRLKGLLREWNLHTVCEEARCPNIGECWEDATATFMILGDVCTRACGYCAIAHGRPTWEDREEPERIGRAVAGLSLDYVVITSVNRDDLADGGAAHWAATIRAVRRHAPACRMEALIPDFQGQADSLRLRDGRPSPRAQPQHGDRAATLQAGPPRWPLCADARAVPARPRRRSRARHQVRDHPGARRDARGARGHHA